MSVKHYDTPELGHCPACGRQIDVSSNLDDETDPLGIKEGDVGMCLSCGEVFEVGPDMTPILTSLEAVALKMEGRQIRLMAEAQAFIQKRGKLE